MRLLRCSLASIGAAVLIFLYANTLPVDQDKSRVASHTSRQKSSDAQPKTRELKSAFSLSQPSDASLHTPQQRNASRLLLTPLPTETYSCDAECQRFQRLIVGWKRDPLRKLKPVAAIYILTHRMSYLRKCLTSLDSNFNSRFKYPVIIFHEAAFQSHFDEIRNLTTSDVFFQQVNFTAVPSFVNSNNVVVNIPCSSPISYRHMCRFQSKLIYQQPIMQQLEYYWRLDDDSLLLRPIEYDVFKYMRSHSFLYGYVWKFFDSKLCTVGLWPNTARYVTDNNITPTFFDRWPEPSLFYNNFEISSTSIWFSDEYRSYIDFIDRLGGIYYYRWGDAPIKGLALSLFVPWGRMHHFQDIGYQHQSFVADRKDKKVRADLLAVIT